MLNAVAALRALVRWLCLALLALLIATPLAQILMRGVFNVPMSGAEELARYFLITLTFVASSYMYATAREWGRLGTLYLQDGAWEGARVLPEGWVDYTRTPAPADRDRVYGAHFWLTLPETYNPRATNLPPGTFHAAGHEGQFVSIVPARGVVVVRLGKTRHAATWDQAQFVADVLAAMR